MTHVTTGHRTCEEPVRNSRGGCPRGMRLAAIGVMAACAVLHLVSLAVAPPASGLATLLLLGMTYACVPCATRAAMAPTRRTWLHAGAVSIAMFVAHPV